jgi:hypothetical protein
MLRRTSKVLLPLILSAALTACIGSSGTSKSNTAPPTVTSIALTPSNSAVTVGKGLQFSAEATYSDGSSKDITATATWQTSDKTVASVSAGNVTGLKPGVVQVGVGSGQVSATTILNVTSKNFSNASLQGAYAFTLVTTLGAAALQFEVGSLNADGNGHISGVEDINGPSGVSKAVSLSGTFAVSADGRGTLSLTTSGQAARQLRFVLSTNSVMTGDSDGILIEFDGAHNAIGTLAKQDASLLANSTLANGTYVFRLGGLDGSKQPISTVGVFTLDSTATTVNSGNLDVNDNGTVNNGAGAANALAITGGSVGSVDPGTGRATASLVTGSGTTDLVIYVVSASKVEMLGVGAGPLIGTAELQSQPAPSSIGSGGYVVQMDIGGVPGQFWLTGQIDVDSTSHFTQGVLSKDGGVNVVFVSPAAAITVGASGRGTFQQTTNVGSLNCTFYMISSSRMYVLHTNDPHAGNGLIELQVPGADGFPSINLNNTFAAGGAELGDGNVAFVVEYVSDGLGHIVGIEDVSQPEKGNPSQLSTSTIEFIAGSGTPSSVGGFQFNVSGAGAGVTGLAVLLQSSSGGTFIGLPNDVDGWLTVQ